MEPNPPRSSGQAPPAAQPRAAIVTHFSNREVPVRERHAQWHSQLVETVDIPVPTRPVGNDYVVEGRTWVTSGMALLSGHFPAVQMVRGRQHVRRDQLDHYMVWIRRSGSMRIGGGSTWVQANAMQPVLVDMTRPNTLDIAAGEGLALAVPRDAVDALLPRPLDLHGAIPRGIASNLLAEHLILLDQHLSDISLESAPGVLSATLHLLMASLAPSIDSLGLARPVIDMNLTRLARKYIEEHLLDAGLSADVLCREFRVSRSALYRLFEPLGGVSNYIRERRLARAHAALSKPGERRYIERIASDHGFNSASQFSRAFREQFGYAPREAVGQALSTRIPERLAEASHPRSFRENLEMLVHRPI